MSYESDVKLLPALEAQLAQLEPQLGTARDKLRAARRNGLGDAEFDTLQRLVSQQAQLEAKRDNILARNPSLSRRDDLLRRKLDSGKYNL